MILNLRFCSELGQPRTAVVILFLPLEDISGTTWGFKQSRYISPYDLKSCRHVKPLQFTNDKIVNRKVNSLWLFILLVDYHINDIYIH